MSGTISAGSRLLARPGVLRTFALGLVGRLGYGVLPLCFLFTVRQATGSFPAASAAIALVGLGSLAMPLQARALDRWGQRRVLPVLTSAWAAVLVAAVGLSMAAVRSPAAWLAVAVPLGLLAPALGPSMRAQWRWFTEGTDLRTRAYSLDTVAEEVLYLVGPVVAGGVIAVGPARWGLVLVAGLAAAGTVALVSSPAARARPEPRPTGGRRGPSGPARRTGMPGLLLRMASFGAGSALVVTGIAAAADAVGHPARAGLVEAGIAAGSVAGGLLVATRPSLLARVPGLLAGCAALVAVAAVSSFWVAGAVLVVAGLAWAPTFVAAFEDADRLAPESERTEASALVNTATNLGSALGAALTGAAVAAGASPYLPAAALLAATALLAGRAGRGR